MDSLSFVARYEEGDEECAERMLDDLEHLRLKLEDRFEEAPGGITVIIHPSSAVALGRAPVPARRPLRGGAGRSPLPRGLGDDRRAAHAQRHRARAPGRRARTRCERCSGPPLRLYAQLVLAANNDRMPPPVGPAAIRPLPALGVADRGRRPVLLGAVGELPDGRCCGA